MRSESAVTATENKIIRKKGETSSADFLFSFNGCILPIHSYRKTYLSCSPTWITFGSEVPALVQYVLLLLTVISCKTNCQAPRTGYVQAVCEAKTDPALTR